MGKVTTSWILDVGEAKSALTGLTSDVNTFNTTVDAATKQTGANLTENAKQAAAFNAKLAEGAGAAKKVEAAGKTLEQQLKSLYGSYGNLTAQQNKFTEGSSEYQAIQARIDAVKGKIADLGVTFDDAGSEAADFDKEIDRIIADFNRSEREAADLQKQLGKLGDVYKKLKADQGRFSEGSPAFNSLQGDIDKVESKIKGLGGKIGEDFQEGASVAEEALGGIGEAGGGLKALFAELGPAIAAVFSIQLLIEFGKMVFDITAKFQKYEAVLTNTLGSSLKAGQALNLIQDIASKTPFSVDELTDSYVKLVNQGFRPTREQIVALGDLASSTAKPFDQLTEAILDAQNGEFERLKEFGIKASQANGKVTFTFKEQQTTVTNTASAIQGYIIGLGKLQGVSGSMAAISQTLEGKISNLGDTFDKVLRIIGDKASFVFAALIDGASAALNFIGDVLGGQEQYSETLLKEQNRVEELRIQITGLNVGNAERTRLIKELQAQYPDLIKNINAETVSNADLSKAIDKVTESLVNRILVQREQEKIDKQAESTADAQDKRIRAQMALQKALNEVYKERAARVAAGGLAPAYDEGGDRNRGVDIQKTNTDMGLPADAAAGRTLALFDKGKLALTSYSQGIQNLQTALKDYIKADDEYAKQLGKSNDLIKAKRDFMAALGITQKQIDDAEGNSTKKVIELTAAQRAQIDQYKKLVDATRDYETALTAAEVKRLNAALLAAQKKANKERADALKDLLKELADLEKQAKKARLDDLEKGSKEYYDELLKQSLAEIKLLEDTIKKKELVYKKKGGTGANADGQLSAEQQAQINLLKQAEQKKHDDAIRQIEEASAAKILDLQKASDEKQLAQIAAKYDKEIAAALRVKDEKLAIALDTAKQLELAETRKNQTGKRLDSQEAIAIELAKNTNGAFVQDNPDATALGAKAAKAAVDAERRKQEAILEIQIDFAKKRLALLQSSTSDEDTLRKLQLGNQIKDLEKQLGNLKKDDQKFDLMKLLGVSEEDRGKVSQAFSEFASIIGQQINDLAQQQVDAANKAVEARTREVDEKGAELDREIELNKQGFASNVETKRNELAEAKAARAQAIKEQKEAADAQARIQTIEQTIALITASVNILQGFSAIPIIGLPLGIAAVAAMFGFFISAKAKAANASKLEKGGWIGGRRHSQGGNKFVSTDGQMMEHEEGEFAVNRKSARKYALELEALNADDEKTFRSLALRHLLAGTGVRLPDDVPKRIQAKQGQLSDGLLKVGQASDKQRLDRMEKHLEQISNNTKPGVDRKEYADRTVEVEGNRTRIIRK